MTQSACALGVQYLFKSGCSSTDFGVIIPGRGGSRQVRNQNQ